MILTRTIGLGLAASLVVLLPWATAMAGDGPRIRFDSTTHDFGALRSDQKSAVDWIFHNDGDAPLTILRTRSSCGCTVSVADETPVPPGASGKIRVEFDPAGLQGDIKRTLAVSSNDPRQGVVKLTVRASVTPVDLPALAEGHPAVGGQSLLMGDCGSCHAAPAAGKRGEQLYLAVCAMCHGDTATGGRAPSLRSPSYLDARSDRELADAIAYGTANPSMPGYSSMMGGPLSEDQVESLVRLLRVWGSTTGDDAADGNDDG